MAKNTGRGRRSGSISGATQSSPRRASYTDGSPVVFGPFGGDDLHPAERRMLRTCAARDRRWRATPWWRRAWLSITGQKQAWLREQVPPGSV